MSKKEIKKNNLKNELRRQLQKEQREEVRVVDMLCNFLCRLHRYFIYNFYQFLNACSLLYNYMMLNVGSLLICIMVPP